MARKKLQEEYESPLDLEGIGDEVRAKERPLGAALGMLYRSTVISQEMIDAIAKYAGKGYRFDAIASRVGVSPKALAGWLRRGKQRREQIDEWFDKRRTLADDAEECDILAEIGAPPVEDDLTMLYDACARSEANGECGFVDVVADDAMINGNTSSAKWMLQTRYSGWSGQGRLPKPEGPDDANTNYIDEFHAKLAALEERRRALAPASADGEREVPEAAT